MTAVEDLLAHYEDSGPSLRRPQQVAHDLRKALAADAKAVLALEAELKQHRQESCQWQVKAQCLEIDLARALRRVAELEAEIAGESK